MQSGLVCKALLYKPAIVPKPCKRVRDLVSSVTWDVTSHVAAHVHCIMGFYGPTDADTGFSVTGAPKRYRVKKGQFAYLESHHGSSEKLLGHEGDIIVIFIKCMFGANNW